MSSHKTVIITMLILTASFGGALPAKSEQKVNLRVDGLACPFCAYGLEKKLKRLHGAEKLDIKINEGLVILHFKEGVKIEEKLISKKVKEAGFTLKELQIEVASDKIASSESSQGRQISLDIKGMACEGCAERVKSALSNLECVQDLEINLSAERAKFTCIEENTDPAKFVETIEKLGLDAQLAGKSRE